MAETQSVVITKDMLIADIVQHFPDAADVMQAHGLHCLGCDVNLYESLEQGAKGHGFSDDKISEIVQDINVKAQHYTPPVHDTAATLTVTDVAAQKLKEIMHQQQRDSHGLKISVVAGGCSGFMYKFEFAEQPAANDETIEAKGVKIFIDAASLEKIGGSEIEYIDSLQGAGFNVKNPTATKSCGCGKSFR